MIKFEALAFGDVIRYKNADYIFLAKTEDLIYLAKILDKEFTKELKQLAEKRIRQNSPAAETKLKNVIFCYVLLETAGFEERAAYYGVPGEDNNIVGMEKLSVSLDKTDLENLKTAIIERPSYLELKELIEQITL